MVSLVKKTKGGKVYYYAVRCSRVNGKPRITWQKYLGSIDALVKLASKNLAPKPSETVLFEAGGVAALLGIVQKLGLIDLINEIVPKRDQGPSVGHYMVLAAINRAMDPSSKSLIGDWYHDTVLQRLWNFSPDAFTSQRFWDHMDMISEDNIKTIQDRLAERIRQQFRIDTQPLLYDSTNFFTFIDTHNARNQIAQRGHNKQKRVDLRQVGLALLTTNDFQIPLFHQAYRGNIPDVQNFPDVARELLRRHKAIFGGLDDATLVFDKGNLSDESMEKLLYTGIYFVAGAKADLIPEVFGTPLEKFQSLPQFSGTQVFEQMVELCGKPCKATVVYSDSFFAEQMASVTSTMTKCQDKLKDLNKSLIAWRSSSQKTDHKLRGPRPTMTSVRTRLKEILSSQHMKDIYTISLEEIDKLPHIRYSTNTAHLNQLIATHFGRTLLISNREKWLPSEIVSTYRSMEHVEEAFKHMKNRDYLRWQPAFHWTDQKLHVHTFYCVLALLLATLARKMAHEGGVAVSLHALLDELSKVKEVALLYSMGKGKIRMQFSLNKMTPRQKKLAEIFGVGEVLSEG